jgi:GDP-D-mannose 3', 5'-epimerase
MLTSGKTALVCGAGGFIGHHLVRRLKQEGLWVRGVDLKYPRFSDTAADEFIIGDLRDQSFVGHVLDQNFDEIYQPAADIGGAAYIFTGDRDAEVMHNSSTINPNALEDAHEHKNKRIFYSSSKPVYAESNQKDPDDSTCGEESAYPALPDSECGREKLFSERLYLAPLQVG